VPLRDLLESEAESQSGPACQERIIGRFLRALGHIGKTH
jgi:hypothetical protein